MATDFFERQDVARRNTTWLIVVFALAVVGIVATTFVATAAAIHYSRDFDPRTTWDPEALQHFPWEVPIWAAVAALVLIGGGSMYKMAALAGGGTGIAERLGGRRIYPNSTDPTERRLLNVVEEMALASGVPVPPVFLLAEEQGINAFAAGFSPGDAVIGVTRGCAEQLTRDQLQGVVAHEFSHILNGDMRLNLRLIGVVHGILLLGLIGRELLYAVGRGRYSSRRNSGGVIYLAAIGLALMVLGFLGTLLGNLIKAAISRQREFLADASAVQFTRQPEGIAGALKRIGAAVFGSRVTNPHAAEASHMYFAAGIGSLFATHPPLDQRIRRLDPRWDGKFPPRLPAGAVAGLEAEAVAGLVGAPPREADRVYAKPLPPHVVGHAAEQVACPTEIHRQYIHELVAAIPQPVVDAAHEPYGARAVIFALLLDRDPTMRAAQLRALEKCADRPVYKLTHQLIPSMDQLDVRARLPLVDMALPALRALSLPQYQVFAQCFEELVRADQRISMFEWALHQILRRHLRSQFEPAQPKPIRYYGLQRLAEPCSVLLSALARASEHDDQASFSAGARHLADVGVRFLPADACGLNALHGALQELDHVAPKQRARLVDACAATICADSAVSVAQAELLRAICDMLDCPLPPLLPGQEVSPALFAPRERSRVL